MDKFELEFVSKEREREEKDEERSMYKASKVHERSVQRREEIIAVEGSPNEKEKGERG